MTPTDPPPPGSTKLVVVAVVMGVVSVILLFVYDQMKYARFEQNSFTVFTLTRTMRPGDPLRRRDYEAIKVPKTAEFVDAFQKMGALVQNSERDDLSPRENERVKNSAPSGSLLTFALFQDPDLFEALQPTDGMRQVALPVNRELVPGNMRPGMYVDIIAPFRTRGTQPVVMTVMERVKVLAVGQRTAQDLARSRGNTRIGNFTTITIEVRPDEAIHLSMLRRVAAGEFELLLRNAGDEGYPVLQGSGINATLLELIEVDGVPRL